MFVGIVWLFTSIDVDAGAEIVTVPLLLAGLGHRRARLAARQRDRLRGPGRRRAPEVGGLQNTATNLGASIGTALAGSLLIATLTTSFLHGHRAEPGRPAVGQRRRPSVELAGGIPFMSDADLEAALAEAGRRPRGRRRPSSTRTSRPGSTGCAPPSRRWR